MNGKTILSKNMYSAFENDIKSGNAGASRSNATPQVNIQLTDTIFNPHVIYSGEI